MHDLWGWYNENKELALSFHSCIQECMGRHEKNKQVCVRMKENICDKNTFFNIAHML